jgi:hypothetical protein
VSLGRAQFQPRSLHARHQNVDVRTPFRVGVNHDTEMSAMAATTRLTFEGGVAMAMTSQHFRSEDIDRSRRSRSVGCGDVNSCQPVATSKG